VNADRPEPAAPPSGEGIMAILPRIAQLGGVMNRGRLFERAIEQAGVQLDRPAMSVLITLRMAERPLRIGEIASKLQVVGPHATRQVQVVEKRGLVRRVADPSDQRARLIELTPEGHEAAQRYLGAVVGWFTEALAGWSAQDRADLGRLMARFADDVTAHLAEFAD
jgi:DNA-binding MarR family transcriptional regulator